MKRKGDILIVEYLIEQIEKIESYLLNKSEDDFYRDDILKDACYARLLVLGEYAGTTSEEFRKVHDEIEWNVIRSKKFLCARLRRVGVDKNLGNFEYGNPSIENAVE